MLHYFYYNLDNGKRQSAIFSNVGTDARNITMLVTSIHQCFLYLIFSFASDDKSVGYRVRSACIRV